MSYNNMFSVCMTKTGEARVCGEFWFLVPPANSSLDKRDKDHRVLLLVDKEEYDTKSEVIVYVPTSHVLLHQVFNDLTMLETSSLVQADMLSIQLLHDAGIEGVSGGTHSGEVFFSFLLDGPYILERYSSSTLLDRSHVL